MTRICLTDSLCQSFGQIPGETTTRNIADNTAVRVDASRATKNLTTNRENHVRYLDTTTRDSYLAGPDPSWPRTLSTGPPLRR